jgi:hypothetical protein
MAERDSVDHIDVFMRDQHIVDLVYSYLDGLEYEIINEFCQNLLEVYSFYALCVF